MMFELKNCKVKSISHNGPHTITSTQVFRDSVTVNGIVTPNLIYQPISVNTADCKIAN